MLLIVLLCETLLLRVSLVKKDRSEGFTTETRSSQSFTESVAIKKALQG
jgi:hypothetical protein